MQVLLEKYSTCYTLVKQDITQKELLHNMKKQSPRQARSKKAQPQTRRRLRPALRFPLLLIGIFALAFLLSGGLMILSPRTWQAIGDFLPRPVPELPAIEQTSSKPMEPTDKLSRLIFIRRAVKARTVRENYVKLSDIPKDLQQAIIAVEDNRFYEHPGFDIQGIMRATLVNLQYGQIEEGASTITQQLVKNLFLGNEQTFGRKAEELLLALDIEANYSKEEILELYLNTIYYGSNYYGIYDASEGYFGKQPRELQLPECAMLAGVPNAPSLYSPYADFLLAKKRQIVVLDAMVRAGVIEERIAEDAKIVPLRLAH